jgi:N-acetylglucosamine-6-sulfatase
MLVLKRNRVRVLLHRFAWRERQRRNMHALAAMLAGICVAMSVTIASAGSETRAKTQPPLPKRPRLVKTETAGDALAARPRSQEPQWLKRHRRSVDLARKTKPRVLFLGDSITQGWERTLEWKKRFQPLGAVNAGIVSDRVEHMLWRVQNGLFATARPDVVVLLGGVNNLATTRPGAIAATMRRLIDEIHARSPKTRILLLGVLPSGARPDHARRTKIAAVNQRLKSLDARPGVTYLDVGRTFLERDGSIAKSIMFDELHLTKAGYARFAAAIEAPLARLLKGADVAAKD